VHDAQDHRRTREARLQALPILATRLGLSRARISQLLDLMLLAPDIQEQILLAESVDGVEPMSERAVRAAVRVGLGREGWGQIA